MEWEPTASTETEIDALPLAKVELPRAVDPSKNMTVPFGVPDPEVTVAVKATACPKIDGLSDETNVVCVVVAPT
jgi:hypothetical protein